MKRSEMLDIIWHSINELEDADHILKAIEKAGMRPPPFTYEGEIHPKTLYWEWEPENE